MTTAKQENPCAMREAPYATSSVSSHFNADFLKVSQRSWPGTVILLLCLFAKQKNYMTLFNFTSHLTVTWFAGNVSNKFFSFPWLEPYLPSLASLLQLDDSLIHQVMVVFDGVHLAQP